MRIRKAPKTEKVYLLLKKRIMGDGFAGDLLPMEPELAEQLQVSRNTIRSALARLALENYIVRIKGQGTFLNRLGKAQDRILVLVRDEESITYPDRYILPSIQQEASAMNLQVETCTSLSLTTGQVDSTVNAIRKKNYRGILCMDSNFRGDEPLIGILKRTGLPVIQPHSIPSDSEKTGFAVMGTDYPQVMHDGLAYLVDLGHRRIAYLSYREHRIARDGYFQLVEQLGLDRDPALYVQSPSHNSKDKITATIEALFAGLQRRPTAVLCFSDYFAICLYDYLQKRHIRIPEDIAVLSIGGMIGCDFLTPTLSAIDFDCPAIGRSAVRMLMEMEKKKEQTRPFTVTPHHLTERESTRKTAIEETA